MVALTFPDGARRDYPNGITGLDVAKGISPSLAKRTVAMALDGVVTDLADPIAQDARIEFLARDDKRALQIATGRIDQKNRNGKQGEIGNVRPKLRAESDGK